ncbi:DUF3159 domain-containing protein [Nocardioides cheoyonin]|uniref:DUF3159 domain-containing protein n=1 Tax=Nocardioides cheoyonin TaxID=3156615 RepID=UPI0032B36C6C
MTEDQHHDHRPADVETVEAVVRRQMAQSLGGRRGMLEAGVPGLAFTVLWLVTHDLRSALVAGAAVAGIALVARLVQRSTIQYVGNAIFGILIGWLVVRLADSMGGTEQDQALAFFVPGVVFTGVYTVVMVATCLAGWPLIGFMVGSVTGDPTGWHRDRQVVQLCSRLTWLFLAPGAVGVLLQGPVLLLAYGGALDKDTAVLLLGILRTGLGWALRIGAWGAMIWLLARNHTPVEAEPSEG